ncbi:AAA family ATPase [Sulfurovum sp. bin170]|uniref:shikimate kinase n=1 Tax=Sulfurovum sp. bin170 TaxID=2695268 RepID=UPI0013DF4778|nr:shikimate kinase [Sulfurovum sp. bin170]NEW59842.1 AAA family ATPase [Sulfurovum sp. bin170]
MKKNIILIGFMGVGKGTTARAYAKMYGVFNIDTDDLIESKENQKVKEIFNEYGEKYFRSLEQDCADWIEESVDDSFISCGGGFYKVENLKKLGKVVLLDASYEWIYNRLSTAENSKAKLKKRPLFSEPKKAKKLYKERAKAYKKLADFVINVEDKDIESIIADINKKLYI